MKHLRSIKTIWERLRYILTEKQKRTCILVIIMIILGSFLETLGVSAILPFIEAILTPETVISKWYVQPFISFFHLTDTNRIIIVIGIGIIIVYFAKNFYLYLSTIVQTIFRSKIQKNLSTKMLKTYMERPYEYFVNINTAEVIRGIGVDVTGVYNLMDNLFRFLGELFTAFLISIFIIVTDAFMALCIIVIAGACFAVITLGLKKKTKYLGEQKQITDTARGNCAYQAIMGFKEIKVTQTTEHFINAYDEAYEKQRVAEVRNEYIANIPERLIEAMCVAVLIGVICMKIAMGTDMAGFVPKLGVFAVAAFRLLPSVSRMTRYMNGIIFHTTFLQSVYTSLIEINSYKSENAGQQEGAKEEAEHRQFKNELTIRNIDWQYQGTNKYILKNLSMTIRRGESVGFIGASGAGKTTLADIILGLLKPEKGSILVDGMDIYSHPKLWSKIIGYVPQSVFLSDDTIRSNVAFGHAREEVADEHVWRALEQAQLGKFVKSLPEGLDTQVGERGIKFSGGQRQRVAIARALYNNPDIIVLDEATSALDNETEKAVMEAIDALQGHKTLIIVAHRLTTIRNCDKIYEIADGKAILRSKEEIFAKE